MKIAFLGDSVTQCANVTAAQSWPQIVGLFNGYAIADIINAGIAGNTTADMLARVQNDVIALAPDVCVMMMTVNDKTHGLTLAQHETNLRSLISQLRAANIKVVIASHPLYRSGVDTWKAWVEKDQSIAGELNIPYVDVFREYCFANLYTTLNQYYTSSAELIHQSVAGNAKIAEVMNRNIYAGVFIKDPPPPSGSCDELTLALADLQLNGATIARLDRVKAALI